MKKKTIVISIIVIQFVVIVFLSLFYTVKVVELNKHRQLAEENQKEALDREMESKGREILLIQQIKSYSLELEKCQGKK